MGAFRIVGRLIAIFLVAASLLIDEGGFAQSLIRENPGLPFRAMVVRVIPHRITNNDDAPAGFGIVIGERDRQMYIATADHVVRDGVQGTLTERPDVVFFYERPDRRPAERLPEHLPPEGGDLSVLRVPRPDSFTPIAISVVQAAQLAWGTEVWNIGRDGEWIVPTSPGGFQDQQPRSGLLVFDRIAAPPGASGSAVVTKDGLAGMLVIDTGRGDVAYALPAQVIERQFREWGFPIGFATTGPPGADINQRGESQAEQRARYELNARNCDLGAADARDPSKPADVPGTMLAAHVFIGNMTEAQLPQIINACQMAADGFPETPRYRYQLGLALDAAGRKAEAEAAFRAAAEAGHIRSREVLGKPPRAQMNLGRPPSAH
jgi:hypothetical protein